MDILWSGWNLITTDRFGEVNRLCEGDLDRLCRLCEGSSYTLLINISYADLTCT